MTASALASVGADIRAASDMIVDVLNDSSFASSSERSRNFRKQAAAVLEKLSTPKFILVKRNFDKDLFQVFRKCCVASVRSHGAREISREKQIWGLFLSSMDARLDCLIQQFVNRKMYE